MNDFKGNYETKDDVKITKNYLSAMELQQLNLLISGFLDFVKFQVWEMGSMSVKDWIEALVISHKRKILIGKGNIHIYKYRKREIKMLD